MKFMPLTMFIMMLIFNEENGGAGLVSNGENSALNSNMGRFLIAAHSYRML